MGPFAAMLLFFCAVAYDNFLLFDACFLSCKRSEVENTCPAHFTNLVELNRLNER